ncbi:cache domain-containing protein [Paenibacillus sp. UNC451MF]|uniref:cache domain-containing protein n=1 Tax=Paenibacillus sp. UNC451MF TaxID=1449063 RepID=UPI00048FB37E|nr:cache domain-containing protein [Paenibacillus sp. UNC451MF]
MRLKWFNSKSSVQRKLLIAFLCLIVFPLGLYSYVSLTISKNTLEEQASASTLSMLGLISEKLNIMAADVVSVSNLYFANEDLHSMLMQPFGLGSYEEAAKKQFLIKMIVNYKFAFTWLEYYTSVFGRNGFELHTYYDGSKIGIHTLEQESWYDEIMQHDGGIVWLADPSKRLIPIVNENHFITAVRALKDFESGKPLGLLMINVNESFLYKQYAYAGKEYERIVMVDRAGTVISAKDKSLIGENLSGDTYYSRIQPGLR